MSSKNPLSVFSQYLADAAEKAGASTALVNARNRFPASGIVYQSDLILTADHAIEREDEITVHLAGGRELLASLAGREPASDLALLRLSESVAQPAVPAGRDARVGEIVLALGRPTISGFQASLGVVSAQRGIVRFSRRGRRHMNWTPSQENYIYTDAVPYPGFSGGPLVDTEGDVLGLNTSGLMHGASVAVPLERAFQIAAALAEHGSFRRGYLGIRSQLTPLSPAMQESLDREQESGLLVVWAETGSPATDGGIIVGDILTAVAGRPLLDHESLQTALSGEIVGREVEIELLRGGQKSAQMVTIGERKS